MPLPQDEVGPAGCGGPVGVLRPPVDSADADHVPAGVAAAPELPIQSVRLR